MGYRKSRVANRAYREAIRRQSDDKFVTCPKCKIKHPEKKNSDAYVCTNCGKVFTVTDPIRKAIKDGLKSGSLTIIEQPRPRTRK